MSMGNPNGLTLTEEEAYALLGMALTSPNKLDPTSERALKKLAEYCTNGSNSRDHHLSCGPQSFVWRES